MANYPYFPNKYFPLSGLGTTAPTAAEIRAAMGLASADLDTQLAGIQTDTTAIVADTNEMQQDLVDGGRLDLIFDKILKFVKFIVAKVM